MNRKLTLLTALALTIAAVPAVTAAPKPDQQLSIAGAPKVVKFGQDLKVTGKLTGGSARDTSGQNVSLQRDDFPYEGKFDRVATADTNDTGDYSFTLKPVTNAKYVATAKGGVQSPELTVPVRVAVTRKVSDKTPKRDSRVKFTGTVAPPHDGSAAKIQRRTPNGWKTVAKATLKDGGDIVSKYSKRVRIRRSGRYRVRFSPGDGDHVAGKSRAVRITAG
jgi:hypothetical protein